jgi:hypothetical protein
LPSANGDASDVAVVVEREMSAGATDAAADVEDGAAFGQGRPVEEQLDELDLGFLFGVCWSEEVPMVDVFAPEKSAFGHLIYHVALRRGGEVSIAYQRL